MEKYSDDAGLSAGRAVARSAREACRTLTGAGAAVRRTTHRRWCAADEQPQSRVVGALVLALGQRFGVHRPKPRSAPGIDHGHNDLEAARRIEHDPVKGGAVTVDGHEVAFCMGAHSPSLACSARTAAGPAGVIGFVAGGYADQPGGKLV